MGFNLGKELNKLKEFAFDAAPYVAMAAPFIPGVNAGVMSLMGKHAPWMQKAMQSKFVNSVMGASVKDALMSYTMAKIQGKRNPHLIAKNALMRGMFINANKAGWDMDMMMGGDTPARLITDVTGGVDSAVTGPMDLSKSVMPNVQAIPKGPDETWGGYGMAPLRAKDYTYSPANLDILKQSRESADLFEKLAPGPSFAVGADMPLKYTEAVENPLAGMGFMTSTKTKPSMLDKLLGRGKDLKELGITAGTPEYDEYFGIGETRPDMAKMLGLGMDYFSDPLTDPQKERKEQEEYEKKMARLMWPRSMADVYGFEDKFLGNQGGLASLANGGRIGYQGGGPAGMSLEELKRQIFSNYMNEPTGHTLFGTMEGMGIPFDKMEGPITKQFYDEMAYDPEGAGQMTPMAPMDFDDDFIFDEGTIGPNPTFEDEFGDYLDLASGPDNQGIHDAYEDYLMNGGTLDFEDWKISIQEVMNPEDWAASRGGKTPKMYGGGDLNAIPGGMVSGPGTETSDSIPAQLSNNEFVVTADAVRAAGGGDIDLGAQKFYGIMNALDPNSAKLGEPPVYS